MVESTLIALDEVIKKNYFFNIPIYQRLYVWGREQIQTLLSDIWEACKEEKEVFYLGGTLVIRRETGSDYTLFDLIDGQQRFTTLWLFSIAFQGLEDYRQRDTKTERRHRIKFAIRSNVEKFFSEIIAGRECAMPEARQLEDAIHEIRAFPTNREVDLPRLTRFIRKKVKLVFTEVPADTDLNKLFEVINNRGVQLQHHEVLKARLLKMLDPEDQEIGGLLWDACSHMNDYVEKNLRDATGLKITDHFDNIDAKTDGERLANASELAKVLKSRSGAQNEEALSLAKILLGGSPAEAVYPPKPEGDYESDMVRSIITFPMLLRIHLVNERRPDVQKILDKDLLSIFQQSWLDDKPGREEVREFFGLLWRTRYLFDKYIIKWVGSENEEVHAIRNLRIQKGTSGKNTYFTLVRESSDANPGFAMLQSMLYHSQQITTHYWLTPLLKFLLEHGGQDAYLYLQYLDNHLLCGDDRRPLIERTRRFLEDSWCSSGMLNVNATLDKDEGTGFAHYWFYKLEYILWEKHKHFKDSRWREFRITAKNSVEHISPQKPDPSDSQRVNKMLNYFGNLALVTRSINSEFSNKSYLEKRARFCELNKSKLDSLKMAMIYEGEGSEEWNDDRALMHQNEMLALFEAYLSRIEKEVRERRHLVSSI